jgi:choice-of-anchor B domain-containing protein
MCLFSIAQTYPSYNISLLSNIAPETTNNWYGGQTKYASCYGWYNPVDSKEYAILGTTKGNYFIEVTNPSTPVVRDYVVGAAQNSLWREIKTYQNYAYLVSDDNNNKLQIVDMSYLPDSVHVVYSSNALFSKSHTLFIDGDKMYCASITSPGNIQTNMAVYSLANPQSPVLLRKLNQDYPSIDKVHDMFVRNDTIYASTGNPGLFIFKLNANNTFSLLADYSNYYDAGYNHSSCLTPDSKTLVFCDEIPTGLSVKVLDVSDFGNLTLTDTIESHPDATAHNPYMMDNYHVIIAYYQDGVYMYDVSDPSNAVLKGFFDTDPTHGDNDNYIANPAYRGCWATYPYLPSGVLLASDMQRGLFVLDINAAVSIPSKSTENFIKLYPNPSNGIVNIVASSEEKGNIEIAVFDITGKKVLTKLIKKGETVINTSIDVSSLVKGSYIIKLIGSVSVSTNKLIIFE